VPLGKELLQRLRVTLFLRRRAESKTGVLEFDVRILAFVDVGVRDYVLARQRLIEFGDYPVRIDKRLQLRPLDQGSLIPMPAIAVNQIVIQQAIFVLMFQIQRA
jgi:hypothetical protein